MTNIRVTVAATAIANASSAELSPGDHLLVDRDRLGDGAEQRQGEVEVVAGELAEPDHPVERLPRRARRRELRRATAFRIALLRARPRMSNVADQRQVEARRPRSAGRGRSTASSEIRCEMIRLASVTRAWIRSSTRLALTGSSSLTSTSTVGCSGLRLASDWSLSSRSGGQDQGREHVPVGDLLLRLGPGRDVDALDPRAELLAGDPPVDPLLVAAELELLLVGDLVQERDPGLRAVAREREPDQDGDHDRVADQQRDDQRRAAQDLQVLEQQPAHRLSGPARAGRRRTPPRSRARSPPTASCSASAVPSKTRSPSASTSSRSP